MPTRWYNPNLPQTLVISQFLLYFDAFYGLLDLLGGRGTLYLLVVAASLYGATGIASTLKSGYWVAVAASFMPIALRTLEAAKAGSVFGNLGYILIGDWLGAIFQYALIALLLHPQSREHQKIWFD